MLNITNRSAFDPYFAREAVSLLLSLNNGPTDQLANQLVGAFFDSPSNTRLYPATDLIPGMVIGKSGDLGVIATLGALTSNLVSNVITNYLQNRFFRTDDGVHSYAMLTRGSWNGRWLDTFGDYPTRMFLLGHSWGGILCLAFGNLLLQLPTQRLITVCSFGSPKVGDDRCALSLRGLDICRWMNVGDSVALAPPVPERAPLLHALSPPNGSANMQAFQHTGIGRVLNVDHSISESMYPPITSIFTELALANFLVNADAPTSIEHSLSMYNERLALWVQDNPEPDVPKPQDQADGPPAQEHRQGDLNPENLVPGAPVGPQQVIDGNLIVQPLPFQEALANIPVPPPPLDTPPPPFYYERVGGEHSCRYASLTVSVHNTKRQAKAEVKRFNAAWRGWNGSLIGDPNVLHLAVAESFLE